jgi:hypothetical protein
MSKSKLGFVIGLGALTVAIVAIVSLALTNIPAPSTTVERVIPNDRLGR